MLLQQNTGSLHTGVCIYLIDVVPATGFNICPVESMIIRSGYGFKLTGYFHAGFLPRSPLSLKLFVTGRLKSSTHRKHGLRYFAILLSSVRSKDDP